MKRIALFAGLFICAAGVTACSSNVALMRPGPVLEASLPAAIARGCIQTDASSQTIALPSAGGVTGTITMGSVGAATGCPVSVTVATGADATLTAKTALVSSSTRRADDATATPAPLPTPLAQVDLSSQATSASWLAITFTLPASVPAGRYPATVTTTVDLGEGQTYSQVMNYTLIVSPNGTAALTGINVTFGQYSSGLLAVYPQGTVLPQPSPVPSASASATPSPAPSVSASAAPTATPTTAPTATPVASATPTSPAAPDCAGTSLTGYSTTTPCGTFTVSGAYDGGPNAGQAVSSSGQLFATCVGGLQCYVEVPAYFAGTVVVTIPNYDPGYQQIAAPAACPYVPQTQSGPHGDTYTLSFPLNGAQYQFSGSQTCTITAEPPTGNFGQPGADATVAFPVYYDS
jgi:hypothetical protein